MTYAVECLYVYYNRLLRARIGVYLLKKKTGKIIITALAVTILVVQGFPIYCAAGAETIDVLYPSHVILQDSFDGEFTAETLAYLEGLNHAEALSTLNVLRGNGGDLMLDRTANRMEGAAMLVRLLGAEKEALDRNFSHPFTDVDPWASPYIGYLYKNGLTNGIGNNLYGSDMPINEKAYLTFLLRSLGFSDNEGRDFSWDTVEEAARQAGLLKPGEAMDDEAPFLRERLSELSWRAMLLNHKTQGQPLLICLYEQGMIPEQSLKAVFEIGDTALISRWYDFLPQLTEGFSKHLEKLELLLVPALITDDMQNYIAAILERVQHETGVFIKGYATELWQEGDAYTLYISPRYASTLQEDMQLFAWIRQLAEDLIRPDMTDYEKVKTVHDFLIIALDYDTSPEAPEASYHAFGALETGKAICGAYAELMALLLNEAGVPCRIVTGTGDGIEHAWNMVYIAGEPYHVDVTWDDPVMNMGGSTLRYDYFNLTDEDMERDHQWIHEDYPRCTATEANYFVMENAVVTSAEVLKKAIRDTVRDKKAGCMLKLQGFTVTEQEVSEMMNEINQKTGYIINSYLFSYDETTGVILIESIEYLQ